VCQRTHAARAQEALRGVQAVWNLRSTKTVMGLKADEHYL
jgi:hypothetical protein